MSAFYFDSNNNELRRGSQTQTKKPGSIRRLAKVLSQYVRTFDLDVISFGRLAAMLPREFDRWRSLGPALFDHRA